MSSDCAFTSRPCAELGPYQFHKRTGSEPPSSGSQAVLDQPWERLHLHGYHNSKGGRDLLSVGSFSSQSNLFASLASRLLIDFLSAISSTVLILFRTLLCYCDSNYTHSLDWGRLTVLRPCQSLYVSIELGLSVFTVATRFRVQPTIRLRTARRLPHNTSLWLYTSREWAADDTIEWTNHRTSFSNGNRPKRVIDLHLYQQQTWLWLLPSPRMACGQ